MNALETVDATAFEKKALSVLAQAQAITISDDASFIRAGEFLKGLKSYSKELDDTFDDPIAKAFASHKAAVAAKKKHSEPISGAERIVKTKLGDYQQAQDRKAREERARLELEARKAQEAEQLARASQAEELGQTEEATAILEEAPAPVYVAPVQTAKVQGVSFTVRHKAKVVNLLEFLAHLVSTKQVQLALGLEELDIERGNYEGSNLNAYAKSTSGAVAIPGVVFYTVNQVSGRSA